MAAAGLWTTPTDLGRWLGDAMRAVRGQDGTLLSHRSLRAMTTPQIEPHVGLGLFLHGSGDALRFGHEGDTAGFQAEVFGYPATGAGFAVMTNSDVGYTLRKDVVRTLAAAYGWSELAPARRLRPDVTPQIENGLAGLYHLPAGDLEVRFGGGALWLAAHDQEPIRLAPQRGEAYHCLGLNAEIAFQQERDGTVHGLLLRQEGQEVVAERVHAAVARWPGAL
jgi:hypothetical protein